MNLNILDIILIIGFAQGFVLSGILYLKRTELTSNFFLFLLVTIYSLVLFDLFLNDAGFYQSLGFVQLILIGTTLLIFPFYYLYTKSLIYDTNNILRKEWYHFVPIFFYKLMYIYLLFSNNESFESISIIFLNWIFPFQAILYLFLIIRLLTFYSKKIREFYSETEHIRLTWLKTITYIIIFTLLIYFTEFILVENGANYSGLFDISSFFAVFNIYAIGYFGLFKSPMFKQANVVKSLEKILPLENKKYEKSGLSDEKAASHLTDLRELMASEKPFCNPSITLSDLSDLLNISARNLSEILNTKCKQNFFDFINSYHVEEVKQLLIDPKNKPFTILAISFDAGFNSKTSFNTIFKKYTGQTPSSYRNEHS